MGLGAWSRGGGGGRLAMPPGGSDGKEKQAGNPGSWQPLVRAEQL